MRRVNQEYSDLDPEEQESIRFLMQEQDIDDNPREEPETFSNCKVITAREMLDNDITEIPMLWGYYLPKNGLALLSGNSDTGKSSLMRQLGTAIVKKESNFLGMELMSNYHNVIYVSTEDDYYSLSARFKMENQSNTSGLDNFRFIFEYKEDRLQETLDVELDSQPADIVVIDALGDVITTDPNNIINVRKFYSGYKRLADRYNCLIVFVHHNRKSSADNNPSKSDVSGSQALEAKPRAVIMLNEVKGTLDQRALKLVKGNFVPSKRKQVEMSLGIDEYGVFYQSANAGKDIPEKSKRTTQDELIQEMFKAGTPIRVMEEKLKDSNLNLSKSAIARRIKENNW